MRPRLRTIADRARAGAYRLRPQALDARLLWIFGSPRSGSTWLLQLLGEHPAVIPVNEPLIGWYLSPFDSDQAGWSPEGMTSRTFTVRRVQRDKRDHFFAGEFEQVWSAALGRMMRERFLAHAMRYPAREPLPRAILALKEPNGSQSADMIMRALPGSRLLFLLRDGRDVVDSDLAARIDGAWAIRTLGATGVADDERRDFVVESAHKWLWRTEVVEEAYAAHRGPKLLVRYEELLAEPEAGLRAILEWLGLDASPPSVAAAVERHAFDRLPERERGPREFFRAASPGLWRENLSADEQAAMLEVIGPKLASLGYEVGAAG